MGTTNQNSTTDIHTKKNKQYKHNSKVCFQITKENKRGREEKDHQKQI